MQNKNIKTDLYKNINKKTHRKKENAWQIEIESHKINKQRRNHKEESKKQSEKSDEIKKSKESYQRIQKG